ncbi:MAG: hypothetical protein K9M99_11865 [Candidatus Cloacimonetes bacterium]|nr:hypothetical protein [Candidatus Cloacimonadota bacterium]
MKVKFLLLALLTGVYLLANSVFAPLGTPLHSYGNDVYGLGMGNTGISDLYRINCNQDNPSLLVTANNVTLSTAVNMGYFWYKSDTDSFRDEALYLPYFTLSVPIRNHRLGISLSSLYSGNLYTGKSGISFTAGDSLVYDEIIRKTEDVFRTSLHYAFKNRYLNLGVSLIYYFGNQVNYWSLDFDSSSYTDSKYEYEKNYSGLGYKLGLSRTFGNVSLGASYEPSVDLSGDMVYRYNFGNEEDTLKTSDKLYKIPENINAGITYQFSNTLKLNLEGNITNWSATGMEYDDGINNSGEYTDSWRIGTGLSYDPVAGYGKWYERIPFRFGGSISKLPFKYNNKELQEMTLTTGSTLQLDSPGRKLDFALRYVYRGNSEHSGYRDESLQLIIGVTGFDIFKKTPKRTGEREIPKVDPGMGVREDIQ